MKKKISAFTLIELLTVISIIWIITLWVSRIYLNSTNDRQNLNVFIVKFSSILDTVKNFSLVWKWIWPDLVTPLSYIVSVSTWWYITTYYNTWFTDEVYDPLTIPSLDSNYKINSITCRNIANTTTLVSQKNNIDIIYKWSIITLSWCTNSTTQRIVDFNLMYKGYFKTLRFNSVSWVLTEL